MTLKSAKAFECSVKEKIKKFYRCANSIFRIDGKSNDTVMLHLLETHCVPLLTYAIEVIHVGNRDERRQLRVAYNCLFRKIFNYRWSESVSALQAFLGRPTWEQLVDKRRNSFLKRIRESDPSFLSYRFLPSFSPPFFTSSHKHCAFSLSISMICLLLLLRATLNV